MSVENIQLNLKQKINTKDIALRGCSLLPDGRMLFSSSSSNTVRMISVKDLSLRFNMFNPLFNAQHYIVLSLSAIGIVVMTLLLSISIITIQLLTPYPDDTAMVLL
jgi:WD40 repeat protein